MLINSPLDSEEWLKDCIYTICSFKYKIISFNRFHLKNLKKFIGRNKKIMQKILNTILTKYLKLSFWQRDQGKPSVVVLVVSSKGSGESSSLRARRKVPRFQGPLVPINPPPPAPLTRSIAGTGHKSENKTKVFIKSDSVFNLFGNYNFP